MRASAAVLVLLLGSTEGTPTNLNDVLMMAPPPPGSCTYPANCPNKVLPRADKQVLMPAVHVLGCVKCMSMEVCKEMPMQNVVLCDSSRGWIARWHLSAPFCSHPTTKERTCIRPILSSAREIIIDSIVISQLIYIMRLSIDNFISLASLLLNCEVRLETQNHSPVLWCKGMKTWTSVLY